MLKKFYAETSRIALRPQFYAKKIRLRAALGLKDSSETLRLTDTSEIQSTDVSSFESSDSSRAPAFVYAAIAVNAPPVISKERRPLRKSSA
jgi:hypothetical protein